MTLRHCAVPPRPTRSLYSDIQYLLPTWARPRPATWLDVQFPTVDCAIPTAHHVSVSPSGTHLCAYPHRTRRRRLCGCPSAARIHRATGRSAIPFNRAFPIGIGARLTDEVALDLVTVAGDPTGPRGATRRHRRPGIVDGAGPAVSRPRARRCASHQHRALNHLFAHRLRTCANARPRRDLRPLCDTVIGTSPKFSGITSHLDSNT
jgi:hypothetical protein